MSNIIHNLTDLIGDTPLVSLDSYVRELGLNANILAKIESFNPGGSIKDRVALAMITDAETSGRLRPGGTIIEPTSGNTGIGLAWIGRARGYKVILTMPDTMSVERRKLLAAFGATLVLTPGHLGMNGAIDRARQLRDSTPGAVILDQFDNPANPRAHQDTTGPEIWRQTDGHFAAFVAGVGTGGTLTGTARFLRQCNPGIGIYAVEPAASPVLEGGTPGPHAIQGIGAGFIPANYDAALVDEIIPVTDDQAIAAARLLVATQGILAGVSSGAALHAATVLARRPDMKGRNIVTIFPDTGDRYLSTPLF